MEQPSSIPIHLASGAAVETENNRETGVRAHPHRNALEIYLPFHAHVEGLDAERLVFQENTILERLSARDMCLSLKRQVETGTRLLVTVELITDEEAEAEPHPRILLRATVLDCRRLIDGKWLVRMTFNRYRFIYAA